MGRIGDALGGVRRPEGGAVFVLSVHGGYGAPVLRIGLFARPDNGWTLLAVADRGDARCRNAQRDQDILYCLGTAFAEREVVLARAAFVAVSFDGDRHVRVAPQPIGLPL